MITTRYLGPTDHRGTRIVATGRGARVVVSWEYGMFPYDNHQRAARALLARLGMDPRAPLLTSPTRTGYVFAVGCPA